MSYSFSVTAETKEEALTAVRDKLVGVVEQQALHKIDCDQVFNAVESLVVLLAEPGERNVHCSVSGSIWKSDAGVQSLSLNISISFTERPKSDA